MTENIDLVVIGQLTLDDVVLFDKPALLDSPGGAGLYALAGVSFWDAGKVGFVTRRGNDYDLDHVFESFDQNFDFRGVKEMDAPSIHIWNMFDRKGNRYFINQRWGSFDDVMGILPEDVPDEYLSAGAYLVSAYPLAWQSKVIAALPEGAMVLADPHFQGIYPEYHHIWHELLKKVTIFLPSEEELLRFFSIKALADVRDYVPYLKKITDLGPQIAGVKVGENGVVIYDKSLDAAWHVPAYKSNKFVDVTGCGDVFCGGFMASYLKDHDPYIAAIHGVVSSSLNLEDYGVLHNFSTPKEIVKQRIDEFSAQLDRDTLKIF